MSDVVLVVAAIAGVVALGVIIGHWAGGVWDAWTDDWERRWRLPRRRR